MQPKYDILQEKEQDPQQVSQQLAQELEKFLSPLLLVLDTILDKRLVRTFLHCCVAILRFRNQKQGLLLSELGSYLPTREGCSSSAPAGTKRISNLLRSVKWSFFSLDRFLLQEADKQVKDLCSQKKDVLCIWDGSVIEKPESNHIEGLCSVPSSKAKRLSRTKKGLVFNLPAKKAVTVTGMHWTALLIGGMQGTVKVAMASWWSTKGEEATTTRKKEEELLRACVRQWGDTLLHIFDRGYASGPWIKLLQTFRIHFVIRWKKSHFFRNEKGEEKKLWQIGQGKKYLDHKEIYDGSTGEKMPCDVWWAPIWHKHYEYQLFLVRVRVRKKVWYLVTNDPIRKKEQAWRIVFAYKRRWQIEVSFRYGKCELGMESPRVWSLENRLKLLGMVTIVYAFLLHLLKPQYQYLLKAVLLLKCHRTGKRCQNIPTPLYRLRWAISRLWDDYHPLLGCLFPPNLHTIQALASIGSWTLSSVNPG
ncbi:transposase [Tengunoibacter tsumagoiensis]|uniref:transposase n=1 Tax=Tengunoibacter tsumagoiensis TaxID=2014871 RepID=UPI001386D649|nr:transposase [Tengunoibacter tsumagoiensis]